jgi:4-hydroxy-tetrahydrodipicolinate synthase
LCAPIVSRRRFLKRSAVGVGAALGGASVLARPASAACPPEIRAALSGPWPTVRPLFTRDGRIDADAVRGHLDFMIEQGKAKALVLTWGDSLYSLLTDDEIAEMTRVVVKHVGDRAMVVAADNQWWTGKEVAFAKYCVDIGADMLMVLPPDWAKSTTVSSLVAHYGAVANEIPVMIVTNYLGRRPPGFGWELLEKLGRDVPGVMALKDDVGGSWIRKACMIAHDHMALSAGGQMQNHMNMLPYGVDGFLATFLTFKPEISWKYWQAVEAGNLDAAKDVIRDYDMPLFDYLIKLEGSFDAGLHGIYELRGFGKRYRRPPYHSLTDAQMDDLRGFLQQHGML